jgi:DNA replication licensing factor MCM2
VLADRGVCLIDEFDKMNEQDRVSIHEAMEQQSISISKAGIVTTLQARCSVIAAANPVKGRYDSSLTFIENVDLTDPILSRFDILAVVKDVVDPVRDELLADFVVGNHIRAHPAATEEEQTQQNRLTEKSELELDQDLLKKYIVYAKKNCKPELSGMNKDKVTKFYATLRQKSSVEGSIPVAVRHIESILRMAVARAKIHMRDTVNESDVDVAIKVMLESFIETQKFSVKQALYQEFKQYMTTSTDSNTLLMHILQQEVRSQQWYQDSGGEVLNEISIDLKEFRQRAKDMDITQLAPFFKSKQFTNSFVLDKKRKVIRKIWENQPGIEA